MRLVYFGTGDIGLPTLQSLIESDHQILAVITQPDKPAGRRQEPLPSPIKQLALAAGLPVWQPAKVRDATCLEELRALEAEVFVVMAYGQILPQALLDLPRLACLNLHASLLPRHRGAAPVQAAILAGDRESGLTVMHMAAGLDTGPMLLEHRLPVRRRETGGSLHARLAQAGPAALAEALRLLAAGQAPSIPQDDALATYAPKLSRETGEIQWERPRSEIDRQIRALNPWPSAYTWLLSGSETKKLKIFSSILYRRAQGTPGTVLRADRHGLLVAARDGAILLREVQMEGKRRMAAGEFLRGYPVFVGVRVGEPPRG